MSDKPLITVPVLVTTLAGAVAIFAISTLLAMTTPSEVPNAGSNSRSISALGYAGLYELLRRADVPAARSQINGEITPLPADLLVMAEPGDYLSEDNFVRLRQAERAVLVLPKRFGEPDEDNPAWIASTDPIGLETVASLARSIDSKINMVRTAAPGAWSTNRLGIKPTFDDNVQLIEDPDLIPILADGNRMLIAEYLDDKQQVWIVADPDILENHGLIKGQNAELAIALMNAARGNGGAAIFDETIHGMVNPVANPFRKLIEFPLVIATLLALVAAALLLWATSGRFGKASVPPPTFDFGKRRLIATSAALLDRAGHQVIVMRRYMQLTLRSVGRAFRAPRDLNDADLAAWLDRIGKQRGLDATATEILARSDQPHGTRGQEALSLFASAGDIHRWKGSISDGA